MGTEHRDLTEKHSQISRRGFFKAAAAATVATAAGSALAGCIRMGLGAGADLSGCNSVACSDGSVEWEPYGEFDTAMYARINKDGNQAVRQPWLLINRMGQRVPYLSTTGTNHPFANTSPNSLVTALTDQGAVEMSQPGGRTYVCFDSKFENLVNENYFNQSVCRVGKVIPDDDPLIDRVPDWQRNWREAFQIMVDVGAIKECNILEELEEALGLREGVLDQAVKDWNAACETGEDTVPPTSTILPGSFPSANRPITARRSADRSTASREAPLEAVDEQTPVLPDAILVVDHIQVARHREIIDSEYLDIGTCPQARPHSPERDAKRLTRSRQIQVKVVRARLIVGLHRYPKLGKPLRKHATRMLRIRRMPKQHRKVLQIGRLHAITFKQGAGTIRPKAAFSHCEGKAPTPGGSASSAAPPSAPYLLT